MRCIDLNLKPFFRKSVLGATTLALGLSLAGGMIQPTQAEAFSLGKIGDSVVGGLQEQKKIKDSLDYYENDGRNEMFEELKKSDGVVEDGELNEELSRIIGRLSSAIAKSEPSINSKPYNYFINPKTEFNAYCSLGHNISVNAGVFSFFGNDEDKIAAVVAHEMVHGQRQHPYIGAQKKMTVDFIQKVAGAQMNGSGKLAVNVVATNVKASGITKPNEWEADNVAFSYVTEAGYNPGAPAAVWQGVIDHMNNGGSKGLFDDLLNPSTHPGEKERRDNYAKKLTEYSGNKVVVNPATAEIKVNNKLFMKPAGAGSVSALERSYLIAGRLAAAYHGHAAIDQAVNDGGVVRVGDREIVQPNGNDKSADELVQTLNSIK